MSRDWIELTERVVQTVKEVDEQHTRITREHEARSSWLLWMLLHSEYRRVRVRIVEDSEEWWSLRDRLSQEAKRCFGGELKGLLCPCMKIHQTDYWGTWIDNYVVTTHEQDFVGSWGNTKAEEERVMQRIVSFFETSRTQAGMFFRKTLKSTVEAC